MFQRLTYAFCSLILLNTAVFAQKGINVALSPLPIWPKDSIIPHELKDRYAFLDFEAGQIVLFYPENLGLANFKLSPGALHLERIDLNNQVQPLLSVTVHPSGQNFDYHYRVLNAKQARQPIKRFNIVVPPMFDATGYGSVLAPKNWTSEAKPLKNNSSIFGTIGKTSEMFLSWFTSDPMRIKQPKISAIKPGTELGGFRVTSGLNPGFTTAYAFGGAPLSLRKDLPQAVLQQVAPMLQYANGQIVATIGPKFPVGTSRIEIASNFQRGISRLIQRGKLDRSSPAISKSLQILEEYLLKSNEAADSNMVDLNLAKMVDLPLAFLEKSQVSLETEILNAMKLSLSR